MKAVEPTTVKYIADYLLTEAEDDGWKKLQTVGNVHGLYSKEFFAGGVAFVAKLYHYITTKNEDAVIFDLRMPVGESSYMSYSIENPIDYSVVEDRLQQFVNEFGRRAPQTLTLH